MNSKKPTRDAPATEVGPPPRGYRRSTCPGCGSPTFTRTGDAEPRTCFACRIGTTLSDEPSREQPRDVEIEASE